MKDYQYEVKLLTFQNGVQALLEPMEGEENFSPSAISDTNKAIAFIMTTSGTTGQSKPVALSHAHLITRVFSIYPVAHGARVFVNVGMNWMSIFQMYFRTIVVGGTRVVATQKLAPEDFARTLEQYKVTFSTITPHNIRKLLDFCSKENFKFTTVETFRTAGWLCPQHLRDQFHEFCLKGRSLESYGMTETMLITVNSDHKPLSAGKLAGQLVAKIVNDHGDRLGPNETGKICVKPEVPMLGYLSDAVNQQVFDREHFFYTGDVGWFDSAGYLFIEGRSNDYIDYRGVTFNTGVIEDFIREKTGLSEVCVMPLDDIGDGGEPPAAAIVKPDSCHLTEDDIYNLTVEHLPAYLHLDGGVYFVKDLPRSAISGKVKRFDVKKLLLSLSAQNNSNFLKNSPTAQR